MAQVVDETWRDACHVLAVDGPHTPKLLSRPEKLAMARRLRDEVDWPYWAIGEAFGVSESRAWRWCNGDEQTHHQVAGRGPSKTPRLDRRRAVTSPALDKLDEPIDREAELWGVPLDYEPEPGYLDDEDDDDESDDQPTPRTASRAKAKSKGLYGWTTPMVVARLRREGHEVDDNGHVLRWAWGDAAEPQERFTAAPAAPASVPPPPALRPVVMAPQRPSASPQGTRSAAGTIAVELECGHVERDLPLNGPWVERRWVACSRCGLAHRSIRRPMR